MESKTAEELLAFIRKSPSCYHVIETICRQLKAHGFIPLQEGEEWKLAQGGSYFVTRNRSSLLAFRIPQSPLKGFQVMASHGDSPNTGDAGIIGVAALALLGGAAVLTLRKRAQ